MKPYYEDNYSVIYCGDCAEIIPEIIPESKPFDLLLTDPPYGIGENSKKASTREKAARSRDYGVIAR